MLYLEDYLEMIENLPMEMRDKFTEMREMDLQVQNAMDSLSDRVKTFFKKCGSTPPAKADWKKEQFDQIKEEYQKALEDADEKVQLANQIYELVERYLRKLDQEVSKFKMELEADNAGITEILEKRSLELDKPLHVNNHRAEKRKYSAMTNHLDSGQPRGKVHSSLAPDSAKDSGGSNKTSSASASPATNMFNSGSTPSSSYNIGHVGPGCPAAIAVAASRAIGATLEMQQGRRTSSMKASYEAVNRGADLTKEFQFGRDLASTPPVPEPKTTARNKKASARQQQQQQQQQPASAPTTPAPPPEAPPATTEAPPAETPAEESTSWQYDPKEPRYCLCNDVSYGDMVACDNEDCPIEWFHYGCVGLNQAPKGKWYCPQCIAAMRRRGRK